VERLSLDCTLGNRTLFSGVSLMPAGSVWTFSTNGEVRKDSYFDGRSLENQPELGRAEYCENLRDTFVRILPRYFSGQERAAVSVTGGLDTRMIMAWQQCPPYKLPCYTFGGTYRDSTDVQIGRAVANSCQQYHETIYVNRKFLSEFPALAKRAVYYTDGTVDVSGSVGIFTHRLARKIAPVRVTGNYGDQAMRSARSFNPTPLETELFDPEIAHLLRVDATACDNVARDSGLTFFISKQMPWYYYPRFALESSQLTVRSPYLDNDLVSLLYRAPRDVLSSKEVTFRLIAEGSKELSRIATDRGLVYPPVPIITRFRNLYQELTFKAEYAYNDGMPQWLARIDGTLEPLHLERLFLGRHKYYHFRIWYRHELSSYVKDVLLDTRTRSRPYLRGAFLEKMVLDHIEGRKNYTNEIHKILTIELIQRQFIEQK
jgi:asparagine synthase (glutamine-hydrolysing)